MKAIISMPSRTEFWSFWSNSCYCTVKEVPLFAELKRYWKSFLFKMAGSAAPRTSITRFIVLTQLEHCRNRAPFSFRDSLQWYILQDPEVRISSLWHHNSLRETGMVRKTWNRFTALENKISGQWSALMLASSKTMQKPWEVNYIIICAFPVQNR